MIKFVFLFLLVAQNYNAFSQSGIWTWVSGDTIYNNSPVYGTQGIPSVTNRPPALYEPCEWKDSQGNLWMYGGYALTGVYADLWKFDIATNQWTWIKGPGTVGYAGVYGTQGVPNVLNMPPSRFCSVTWVDAAGDFWLFGGSTVGVNKTDDLWKYNVASNTWTWMKGTTINLQLPVYGIQGISDPLNTPGARYETSSSWTDANDDLWFFGGYILSNTILKNDLWKFEKASNNWVWMKGSQTQDKGTYGQKGIAASSNTPGARQAYSSWKDSAGNFYLFGGLGFDADSLKGNMNDLWKYSPSSNEWTWLNGTDTTDDVGSFGIKQMPAITNLPPSRLEHRSSFTDDCGNFWMFGGISYYLSAPIKYYNDLWKYDVNQNIWTWMAGDSTFDQLSVWGTKNVPALTNKPGARSGALTWYAGDSTFYMFGGFYVNVSVKILGDLWKFKFDTTCAAANVLPVAAFAISDTVICSGSCITLSDQSLNTVVSRQWIVSGPQNFNSSANNLVICPTQSGYYNVTLIVCNSAGCDTLIQNNAIKVDAYPQVFLGNDTLICDTAFIFLDAGAGYSSYNWSNSATTQLVLILSAGNYFVDVANGNCITRDSISITTQNCALPGTQFDVTDTLVCAGTCLDFFDYTANNPTSWQWTFTGANTATSTLQNPSGICYQSAGAFTVSLVACNPFGCDTLTSNNLIKVDAIAPVNLGNDTTICAGDTLILNAGSGYNSYLWSNGETTQTISVFAPGSFDVFVTSLACESFDTISINVQSCLIPVAQFSSTDTIFCEKNCLDFTDLSGGNVTSWQWSFVGASPDTSTAQNPAGICYNNYGNYSVTLIACNSFSCDTLVLTNFVQVFQNPVDSIWQSNDTLFSLPAFGYQWYDVNGGLVAGATLQYFVPQTSGSFYCVVTDSIGCVATSNTILISGIIPHNNLNDFDFAVYPNPAYDAVTISVNDKTVLPMQLKIYDATGRSVFADQLKTPKQKFVLNLAQGLYRVELSNSELKSVLNLIVE